jgi:hypothetical protein
MVVGWVYKVVGWVYKVGIQGDWMGIQGGYTRWGINGGYTRWAHKEDCSTPHSSVLAASTWLRHMMMIMMMMMSISPFGHNCGLKATKMWP